MERPLYANSVNITADNEKTEVVLSFVQKYPAYDVTTGEVCVKEDVITSVVIPRKVAESLPEVFQTIFNDGEQ